VAREWAVEFRIETQSGIRWVWGHAVPVNDSHPGQLFRGVLLDVTPRKELEQQLQQAATHDWLTGALNRAGIEPQLETGLAGAQRAQKPLAVLMLDIDHFKTVNDTFGHTVGDEVLKQLVTTIQNRLRKSDSLARWGGEEFLILLPDTDRQGACQLAETLRRGVADQPFTHGQKVTISLGATEARTDETVNSLVQRADDCLYQAKTLGRNRVIAAMEEDQTVKPS